MSTLLDTFSSMNSKAIELMRAKMYHMAEDLWDQGIQFLEVNYDENKDTKGRNQGYSLAQNSVCSSAVLLAGVSVAPAFSMFVAGSKQDCSFAMYDKAFGILPTVSSTGLSSSDASLLLCVFHYNLGLCYRLCGLASRTTKMLGGELEKSLFAYEMAYNYLEDSSPDAESPHRLLELALLNNMGHTCCLLWDIDEAIFRLGQMKVLLDESLHFHKDEHGLSSCPEDLTLFSNNVNYNESLLAGMPAPAA